MPVTFESINNQQTITPDDRRRRVQDGAEGLSVAAGTSTYAKRYVTRHGVFDKFKSVVSTTTNTAKTIGQNSAEVEGLLSKFSNNAKKFAADTMARISKYKDWKFIGPIVKSPVMKAASGVFGATMAFFVLVSGVGKAIDNGKISITDIKNRLDTAA